MISAVEGTQAPGSPRTGVSSLDGGARSGKGGVVSAGSLPSSRAARARMAPQSVEGALDSYSSRVLAMMAAEKAHAKAQMATKAATGPLSAPPPTASHGLMPSTMQVSATHKYQSWISSDLRAEAGKIAQLDLARPASRVAAHLSTPHVASASQADVLGGALLVATKVNMGAAVGSTFVPRPQRGSTLDNR
jgi:hypothetical protein